MSQVNSLLASIRRDISNNNVASLFNTLEKIDSKEIDTFYYCREKVFDIIEDLPTLRAVADIYKEIAPFVRKAFDQNEINENDLFMISLDAISLVHVASQSIDCVGYGHYYFIMRNRTNFAFWRWFRAHVPADLKIVRLEDFEFHPAFVLLSILLSNPHDLRFYKELCLDLKARSPAWYDKLSIEPEILEAIVTKAIAIEKGETPRRCSVPMAMVKNNIFIADFLR